MAKEIPRAFWLILCGVNIGMLTFSISFHQNELIALNILSAISFLVGYFATKKNEDDQKID